MAQGLCHCFAPPLLFPSARKPSSSILRLPIRGGVEAELKEIRVCTNRTCRRQGSIQTLETLTSLAPPVVTVKSSGCLGQCGAGPNIVALPDGVVIRHCGTAARAAEIMVELCGLRGSVDADKCLEALALRKRAEAEIEKGNFSEGELLLSQVH